MKKVLVLTVLLGCGIIAKAQICLTKEQQDSTVVYVREIEAQNKLLVFSNFQRGEAIRASQNLLASCQKDQAKQAKKAKFRRRIAAIFAGEVGLIFGVLLKK